MRHGGARPGAGRKKGQAAAPKEVAGAARAVEKSPPASRKFATALDYLMDVVNDDAADRKDRLVAAQVAVPYTNAKLAESAPGKKEKAQEKAKAVAGRFSPSPPPLRLVNKE